MEKPILAVCGKGGVGKTVFSALLGRAFLEGGIKPLLLIDADPAGGLASAIGEHTIKTLAGVRQDLILAARGAGNAEKMRLAQQLDYLVMEALLERPGFALLAMGHSKEGGCYCPANKLLRDSIDIVADSFSVVLIDAEAGLEQINRRVTRRVNRVITIIDGSMRSVEVMGFISEMVGSDQVFAVGNRMSNEDSISLPKGIELLGMIPEDESVRQFDREGRSLWDLPPGDVAFFAVKMIAQKVVLDQREILNLR